MTNSFVTLTFPIINLRIVHSSLNLPQASQAAPNTKRGGNESWLLIKRTADPSAPPDFLWNLVALANFMRLSLLKGANAALSCAAWQEIRVRSG